MLINNQLGCKDILEKITGDGGTAGIDGYGLI